MRTVAFHNLGCKVNSYEMDVMQQKFAETGYAIVPFDFEADVYVVNTCTVTNIADRKSRQMLHRAKKQNPNAVVVAAGCYVQTDSENIKKDASIDLCIGNNRKADIVEIVEEYLESHGMLKKEAVVDIGAEHDYEDMTLESTPEKVRAYIKIQDGCNQFCTYCAIPYARGRVRSRAIDKIVAEIEGLVGKGYKEFVLTGIHISSYGKDFNRKKEEKERAGEDVLKSDAESLEKATLREAPLLALIKRIATIDGVIRLRLGSLEPRIVTEEFAKELSKLKNVCPHFHLSLQSGCNATLKRMNRHYTAEEYYEGVKILRKYFENPAITTDIITGFPGETEEEFKETEEFVKKVNFYETHIFKYSPRKGTVAAGLKGQNTESVKTKRSGILEKINKENSKKFRESFLGKEVSVLIEEEKEIEGKKYMIGHTPDYIMVATDNMEIEVNSIITIKLKTFLNDGVLC